MTTIYSINADGQERYDDVHPDNVGKTINILKRKGQLQIKVIKKMKTLILQPKTRANGQMPYPYFIEEDGNVGRQDFWKGEPLKLIGFDINPSDHGMSNKSVDLSDFIRDPEIAVNMYPIFEHKDGEWYTYEDKIKSVNEQ